MKDHEKRVVEEHKELETKIKALQNFIEHGEIFQTLPTYEQKDMRDQLSAMEHYSFILNKRIRRFSQENL